MKKIIFTLITLTLFINVSAQTTVKEYHNNGQLKSIGKQYSAKEIVFNNKKMQKLYKDSPWLQPKPEKVGEWKWYNESGQLIKKGFYSEGKSKDGTIYTFEDKKWIAYYSSGAISTTTTYKDGRKEGVFKSYYKNGNLYLIGNYKRNKKVGEWKYTYTDGGYKVDLYVADKLEGQSKSYYKTGELHEIKNYENGKKHGESKTYYVNGQIKFERNYSNGLQIGESKDYNENGTLSFIGNYSNDLRVGEWKWFDENGKLKSKANHYPINPENPSKFSYIKLLAVYQFEKNNEKHTRVKLEFSKTRSNGTLYGPSSSNAFYLVDTNGKKYMLIGQKGWKGDGKEGFGWKTLTKEEFVLTLTFERVPIDNIENLNLIEGENNGDNGWHIYNLLSQNKTIVYASDECISGDCENGTGTYKWNTGEKYTGEFKYGRRNGKGTNIFANGDKYVGEFDNDEMDGWKSVVYYKNGNKFEGSFENGEMKYGTFTFTDGKILDGRWRNSKLDGNGSTNYPNGDEYDGEYKEGLAHGYGILTSKDGSQYKGLWEKGARNGEGIFYKYSGDIYKGKYKNDKKAGGKTYSKASEKEAIIEKYFNGAVKQKYSSKEKKQESFEKVIGLIKKGSDLDGTIWDVKSIDYKKFIISISEKYNMIGSDWEKWYFLDFKNAVGLGVEAWESGEIQTSLYFDPDMKVRLDNLSDRSQGELKEDYQSFKVYFTNNVFDAIELENEIEKLKNL